MPISASAGRKEEGGGWQGYVNLNCHSCVLDPGKYVTCAEPDAVQRSVLALWKEEDRKERM